MKKQCFFYKSLEDDDKYFYYLSKNIFNSRKPDGECEKWSKFLKNFSSKIIIIIIPK